MRRGERPWFAKQGPPRRPLSPFGGCSPGVLILVFSMAWNYSSATRQFSFSRSQIRAKIQRAALATFRSAPLLQATKNLPLLFCIGNVTSFICYTALPSGERTAPSAAREGGSIQLQCAPAPISARTSITRPRASTSCRRSSISCLRSASTASCFRPITPTSRSTGFYRLPVSDADRERIAHGNAERPFGI